MGMRATSVVTGNVTAADIQFQVNLLLNLMRARAQGGKVYANVLSAIVGPSGRKRSASLVLTLDIEFSIVADNDKLASIGSNLQNYADTQLASDSGLRIISNTSTYYC